MKFPYRAHLRGAAIVIEIFKRHALHLNWQGLRQLSAVLRIQLEAVFGQLRLCRLPRTAILTVYWSLYNDAGCGFVRRLRNLEMHITISRIYAYFLQEGSRNMKDLEFAAGPRRVGRDEGILRPTQDSVDSDFLGSYVGNCGVLGDVAEIRDVGLNRKTLAQIFGSRLQDSVVAARARTGSEP